MMINDSKDNDFGVLLSNKSIEYFDNGNYLEAVTLQLEVMEDFLKFLIRNRAKYLGSSKTKIHELADEGDLETRINNLIELCGADFKQLCINLQD